MAFPLIPVLIGAAVGAAVTYYLTTNKDARKRLSDAAQDVSGSVQARADQFTKIVSDKMDDASKAVKDAASQAKDAAAQAKDAAAQAKDAAADVAAQAKDTVSKVND